MDPSKKDPGESVVREVVCEDIPPCKVAAQGSGRRSLAGVRA